MYVRRSKFHSYLYVHRATPPPPTRPLQPTLLTLSRLVHFTKCGLVKTVQKKYQRYQDSCHWIKFDPFFGSFFWVAIGSSSGTIWTVAYSGWYFWSTKRDRTERVCYVATFGWSGSTVDITNKVISILPSTTLSRVSRVEREIVSAFHYVEKEAYTWPNGPRELAAALITLLMGWRMQCCILGARDESANSTSFYLCGIWRDPI